MGDKCLVRQRERVSAGERERERARESLLEVLFKDRVISRGL